MYIQEIEQQQRSHRQNKSTARTKNKPSRVSYNSGLVITRLSLSAHCDELVVLMRSYMLLQPPQYCKIHNYKD